MGDMPVDADGLAGNEKWLRALKTVPGVVSYELSQMAASLDFVLFTLRSWFGQFVEARV